MNFSQLWKRLLLLSLLTLALPLEAGNLVYDFEGPSKIWRGDELTGGPWLQSEWRAFGAQALKADIRLKDGGSYDLNTRDISDLRSYGWISATITRSWWGNFNGEFLARIYVKTGQNWQWHEGVTVPVAQPFGNFYYAHNTVLDLDLSQIKDLDQVREIGVQFLSQGDNSGSAAIYLDQLTLVEKTGQRIFPRWVRANQPLADTYGRFFETSPRRIGLVDMNSGKLKWSRDFDRSVRIYLPEAGQGEALYAMGEGAIWSINRDTGSTNWQSPLRSGLVADVQVDTEGNIFLNSSGADNSLIALNKKDGTLRWQAAGVSPSYHAGSFTGKILNREGIILGQARDPLTNQLIIVGLSSKSGARNWTYREDGQEYLSLYLNPEAQLFIQSSGDQPHLSALDLQSGLVKWTYQSSYTFSIETGASLDHVLLIRGSYEAPTLSALDPSSGRMLWTYRDADYFSVITDKSGRPFIQTYSNNQQTLTALNADGSVRWSRMLSGYASVQKEAVFFTDNLGDRQRLTVLDPETGATRWTYTSKSSYLSIPGDDRDVAIVDGKELLVFDPLSGQMRWQQGLVQGSSVLQVDPVNYYIQEPSSALGPGAISALQKNNGQLRWTFQPGYWISGLQLGSSKAATANGLLLLQYQVGSKFPISQGLIALPQ